MPGLEGSDYRQNGFASASASACVSVERTGPQVSSVEALDWDPPIAVVTLAPALANPFRRTEGGTAYGGKSPTQNGEEPTDDITTESQRTRRTDLCCYNKESVLRGSVVKLSVLATGQAPEALRVFHTQPPTAGAASTIFLCDQGSFAPVRLVLG
jgi:hypothetical protein